MLEPGHWINCSYQIFAQVHKDALKARTLQEKRDIILGGLHESAHYQKYHELHHEEDMNALALKHALH